MPDNTKLTEVLAQCHQGLDELFLLHQEAVLMGRFTGAIQLFNYYEQLHLLHMGFEDQQLIPKLGEIGDSGRWPASLYAREHAKVQDFIRKIENTLMSLSKARAFNRGLRREVIEFLDMEKTFKGLCEHHQEREESGILPELDKETDTNWRTGVIKPFLKAWNDRMEYNMNIINGIASP